MKSRLFNIMLGCLAALSLAGCGGHNNDDAGSPSSTSSSNPGLLNPGSARVTLEGKMVNASDYCIDLKKDGSCIISVDYRREFRGSWQALTTEDTEAFMIKLVGPFTSDSSDFWITPADTVKLSFPGGGLEAYRAGNPVSDACFDKSPFNFACDSEDSDVNTESGVLVTPR